jgi:hypothetical protein
MAVTIEVRNLLAYSSFLRYSFFMNEETTYLGDFILISINRKGDFEIAILRTMNRRLV